MLFLVLRSCVAALFVLLLWWPAAGQDILLDRPVRAADLTLFPSLSDTTRYYYVPDQARLAEGDNGLPQFSFLRYASTTDSGEDAEGGGIVHAVVTLTVPDREITRAQAALNRVDPAGTIVGPVVYRSGLFGLVSSFQQENGDLTRRVVGLGRAPVLDGGRAAVSLRLTRLGAQILWESFQLPTPDISFTFEMEMSGYFSPVSGSVVADYERIYNQQEFAAGVAVDYLGAEIGLAFDRARDEGAISVEIVGDDAQLEKLVHMAYERVSARMFDKDESQDAQKTLASLSQRGGQNASVLDRAYSLLAESSKNRGARNKEIRASNQKAEASNARFRAAEEANQTVSDMDAKSDALRDSIAFWEERIADLKTNSGRHDGMSDEHREDAEAHRKRAADLKARRDSLTATASNDSTALEAMQEEITGLDEDIALAERAAEESEKMAQGSEEFQSDSIAQIEALEEKVAAALDSLDEVQSSRPAAEARAEETAADAPSTVVPIEDQVATPGFAAMATYKMKRTRQSGTFRANFNKYTSSTITLRFDENIGDLRQYFGNESLFKEVQLDDPLYVQREVQVSIDGLNADHFGQFVNFVSVLLRKKHRNGQVTMKEVTVRRQDFNERGNDFRMVYGWNGDHDRNRWLDYEYKAVWSLFGNINVESPWVPWRASAIPVAPPYQPKIVTLEAADATALEDQNVRAIRVSLVTTIEGEEKETKVTMVPSRGELSRDVELLVSRDDPTYTYSLEWVVRGGGQLTAGPHETTNDLLFVDELPQ